jgi:hypothetical protein
MNRAMVVRSCARRRTWLRGHRGRVGRACVTVGADRDELCSTHTPMGMNARVLMVGQFTASLVPHLPRPRGAYAGLREGATIVEPLAPCAPGSSASRALAAALGIAPWDVGTHAFSPERVDRETLLRVLSGWADVRDAPAVIARLDALGAARFRFFFRPEG